METSQKQFKSREDRVAEALIKSGTQTREIEIGLLGGLLHAPHYIYDVIDSVSPKMFSKAENRKIYEAMLEMHEEGLDFDTVLLKNKSGVSATYMAEVMGSVISGASIKKYVKELQSGYVDTMLISSAESIQSLAINTKLSSSEKIDRSERLLIDATALTDNRKYNALKDVLAESIARLENNTPKEVGVTSGFKSIDKLLYGFQKSDLIILAARPGVGKTTLAMDFARYAAKAGVPVGVFSLEMSERQLGERMLASESGLGWKIKHASVNTPEDKVKLTDAITTLTSLPIFIDSKSNATMATIKSSSRRMKKQEKVGLIIVDYLQLIKPSNAAAPKNDQVSDISNALKNLAKELDIPIVALAQLNRAVESRGGTPRLSDLRDSGSIEQDADIVMFIHREDKAGGAKEKTGIADILVEKHRNGADGRIQLMFDNENTTFTEMEFAGNLDEF